MGALVTAWAGGAPLLLRPPPLPEMASMISDFFSPVVFTSIDLAIALSSVTAFDSSTERSMSDTFYASCIEGGSSPRWG